MMFPCFRVVQNKVAEAGEVLGAITATTRSRETWVGNGWIGYLMADMQLILGLWHIRSDLWGFAPEDAGNLEAIVAKKEWLILDGYWGQRAEIVLDSTREWRKARFEPSHAVAFREPGGTCVSKADSPKPPGGELIKGGWDHEHCAICWETLGSGGQPEGYLSQNDWVCEHCFERFVQQRSLDFIRVREP